MLINPSIVLREGNVIKTMSKQGMMYAEATIAEDIPHDVGISNISKFLSILSLYQGADIIFKDKYFSIVSEDGRQKTKYVYDDIGNIISPPPNKSIKFNEDNSINFVLPNDVLHSVMRAASVLNLEDVAFIADDGKLMISAIKTNESSYDEYHYELSDCEDNFRYVVRNEYLKLLQFDYRVSISENGKLRFASDDVTYYIPAEIKKSFKK